MQTMRDPRWRIWPLLLVPWPALALGYWAVFHITGPNIEGFGAGGYSSAVVGLCHGIGLYALNRAIVRSARLPRPTSADRVLRVVAFVLFGIGVLALAWIAFFLLLGLPFSLPGAALILVALLRWRT
jgi:hypothetical protein